MSLLKNSLIYSGSKGLGVLLSLTLLPIFTKYYDGVNFGIVGILWVLQPLLSRFLNLGVDVSAGLKIFKVEEEKKASIVYHALLIIFVNSMVLFILLLYFQDIIVNYFDNRLSLFDITLFYFQVFANSIVTMMISFLALEGKAIGNSLIELFNPLITTVLTFWGVKTYGATVSIYILAMFASSVLFFVMSVVYFYRRFPISNFRYSKTTLKALTKIGLPIVPATIAGLILAMGDRIIIKHYLGLESVGIYAYGYKFANALGSSVLIPFHKAFMPILLKKATENFDDSVAFSKKNAEIVTFLFPVLLGAIVIPMKDIMLFLSNEIYSESYYVFLIAILGLVTLGLSNIYTSVLFHLEKTKLGMKISFVGAIINTLANIVLIPYYGLLAAAFTTVISYWIMLFLQIHKFNKFVDNKISSIEIFSRVIPFVIFVIIVYIIDMHFTGLSAVIIKILMFMVFFIITIIKNHKTIKVIYILGKNI